MRISNPISYAGNKPLATREYVNGSVYELSDEVKSWLTGNGKYAFSSNGYAWLNSDGKVDPSVIPPLAITKVITVPQWDVIRAATEFALDENAKPFEKVNAWLRESDGDTPLHKVQVGDIILVTFNEDDQNEEGFPEYQKPYKIDSGLIGPYIVVFDGNYDFTNEENDDETYDPTQNPSLSPEVQKLIFPTNQVLTVNGVTPNATGDILLDLSNIYRDISTGPEKIGDNLAAAICRLDPEGILSGNRLTLFEIQDESQERVSVGYAKLHELNEVSGTIDNIKADLGTRADNPVVGTDAEKLQGSVFGQLKAFYNDNAIQKAANEEHFTILDNNAKLLNEQVSTIDSAINNTAIKVIEVPLTWQTTGNIVTNGLLVQFNCINVTDSEKDLSMFGYPDNAKLWTATIQADGKVMACYEENSNKLEIVYPDIEFQLNAVNNKWTTTISLVTLPEDNLLGKTWRIYITENITYSLPEPSGKIVEPNITHEAIVNSVKEDLILFK